jgi:leucyl-tRNA synthetase
MKDVMTDPKLKSIAKQVSQFVGKLPNEVMKLNDKDKQRYVVKIKESNYLKDSKEYLEKTFSCDIDIYSEEDKKIYDPSNKSRFAAPLRPAIYIE